MNINFVTASKTVSEHAPVGRDHDSQIWQQAQERVLSYLKLLDVSAVESLRIAYNALQQAQLTVSTSSSGTQHPVMAAMQALRQVLGEIDSRQGAVSDKMKQCGAQKICSDKGRHRSELYNTSSVKRSLPEKCVISQPPVNRSSMIPEKLEISISKNLMAILFNR